MTTRIITFLIGNPYKPSFVTVTGWGVDRRFKSSSIEISPHGSWMVTEKSLGGWMVPFYGLDVCQLGLVKVIRRWCTWRIWYLQQFTVYDMYILQRIFGYFFYLKVGEIGFFTLDSRMDVFESAVGRISTCWNHISRVANLSYWMPHLNGAGCMSCHSHSPKIATKHLKTYCSGWKTTFLCGPYLLRYWFFFLGGYSAHCGLHLIQ